MHHDFQPKSASDDRKMLSSRDFERQNLSAKVRPVWGVLALCCVQLGFGCTPPAPEAEIPSNSSQENGPAHAPHKDASTTSDKTKGAPPSSEQAGSEKHSPEPTTNAAPIEKSLPTAFDCSGLTCYGFTEAREALVPLLLHEKAQLIAFGEAHAPVGFQGASTVRRFTDDLLPTVSDGASHLLLELLLPPDGGCEKEKEASQQESNAITEGQSAANQNEYLTLGKRSRELGIIPDILRATCDDLRRIAAPDGGVFAMMETIADASVKSLSSQIRTVKKGRPMVLAYGGALHNDATPRAGRETWSYGPRMIEDTKGRYLEIDLIVPELVGETDSWKTFAWYDAYRALGAYEGAVLMKWGERSYSLFFPRAAARAK